MLLSLVESPLLPGTPGPSGEQPHQTGAAGTAPAEIAEQLLELQWRRGDSPWKEEAALALIRQGGQLADIVEAEEPAVGDEDDALDRLREGQATTLRMLSPQPWKVVRP